MIDSRRACGFALAVALVAGCSTPAELRLGLLVSQTGAAAGAGERVQRGVELAVERLNAAGGIDGRQVRLLARDDATNGGVGAMMVHELVSEARVSAIIGAVTSPVTLEVAPICERERVVLVTPAATAREITDAGDYVFRTFPSEALEGAAMADFARDLELDRVVVFAIDDGLGQALAQAFVRAFGADGIAATFTIPSRGAVPWERMVRDTLALAPDAIYIVGYVAEHAAVLERLRGARARPVVLSSAAVIERLVREVGDAAEGLVFAQPTFDPAARNPVVAAFAEAYRERWDEEPDIWAAHGYDAVNLIAEAVLRADSTDPEELRLALAGIDDFDGAAGRTSFDANGDVVRYPQIFVVHGGRAVSFQRFLEAGGRLRALAMS